ncbi:hypothetical protein niasHS_007990 [Heterodera schachtii]|uniref:Uncharacterized protein n=1 Tax=Heterodera schachtii TaxID=97005 RepID=A0ABD2JQ93_HETSC
MNDIGFGIGNELFSGKQTKKSYEMTSSVSSSSSLAHHHRSHFGILPLIVSPLFLCLTLFGTDAIPIDGVDDAAFQPFQQRQPFALFAVAQEADENGGIGSASLMAKRHLFEALARQGRSPRSASSATMRNALVRFGKRALFPSVALDDKRNPPQPFVRFGRSAAEMVDQQQQQPYFPAL